jgi:hypothetical protein
LSVRQAGRLSTLEKNELKTGKPPVISFSWDYTATQHILLADLNEDVEAIRAYIIQRRKDMAETK